MSKPATRTFRGSGSWWGANGEDEFKINDYLSDFALDLIRQIVKDELLERAKLLLEYLFDIL